MMCE